MRKYTIISLLIIISIMNLKNAFSIVKSDTVILITNKQFSDETIKSNYRMERKNNSAMDDLLPEITGIPDSISNFDIYYYPLYIDHYRSFNELKKVTNDTSSILNDFSKFFILVVGKSRTGLKYFAISHKCKIDFSEEKFNHYKGDYFSLKEKIYFIRRIDNKTYPDSSKIFVEYRAQKEKGNAFLNFMEYMKTEFNINSYNYKIFIKKKLPGISYKYVYVDLFEETTNKTEYSFEKKEFIKLNDNYYKIDSISLDGRIIILVKEKSIPLIRQSTQIGWNPIPFEMKTVYGDTVNFPYDFKGQYVLLYFWSLHSGSMKMLEETYALYANYEDKGFTIIGICEGLPDELKSFLLKNPLSWPQICISSEHQLQQTYNIFGTGQSFLIGPNGKIIAKKEELNGKVKHFLKPLINFKIKK
jgi:peroxiredoxin